MKKRCVFSWSGGKDSTLALHEVLQDQDIQVEYLLTTVNDGFDRVSMHGVRSSLLVAQAQSLGIPLYQIRLPEMPGMETYELAMEEHLNVLKSKGITQVIYGDIYLEDLRTYRENKLAELGLSAIFPLWKKDTSALIRTFIELDYQTIVVCAHKELEGFCGRIINEDFLNELPGHVDPCGENGEFHTFVFNGPIFKNPVPFITGEKVYKTYETAEIKDAGYWYMDLLPDDLPSGDGTSF